MSSALRAELDSLARYCWGKSGKHKREATKRMQITVQSATESKLEKAVSKVLRKQVSHIVNGLRGLSKSSEADAADIMEQVFDPDEWLSDIVNAVTPVVTTGGLIAATQRLELIGVPNSKASSTATEWLEEADELLPPGVSTEFPNWMKQRIGKLVRETMQQPYWKEVSRTTAADIEKRLARALKEGKPITAIAKELQSTRNGYSDTRARAIARTESAHVLNGAQQESVDKLREEVGTQVSILQVWLSVLGNTTRDTHAVLDGVPEDEEGNWLLGGVSIPWPGHYALDPGERINCQCTTVTEFGVDEDEANRLIAESQLLLE